MKRKSIRKQESVTKFIRRNQGSISNMKTMRERHENTKERLNHLITSNQIISSNNENGKDGAFIDLSPSNVNKSNDVQTQLNPSSVHRSPNLLPINVREVK